VINNQCLELTLGVLLLKETHCSSAHLADNMLLSQRSEHNERCISTLEELALHQQHIEKIELLNQACRHLKILLLQNNVIPKLENLHRMKQLQYLNVALNNISKIQNLQSCESLTKLDMTMNFVPKAGLLSVSSLDANHHFEELYLLGNPCSDWPGYRDYVIGVLPRLQRLDGHTVKPSDRIIAEQVPL
jgi:protein TilB